MLASILPLTLIALASARLTLINEAATPKFHRPLLIVPAAETTPGQYLPLAKQLLTESELLFIAILDRETTSGSEGQDIAHGLAEFKKKILSLGFSQNQKIVGLGHSDGGLALLEYASQNEDNFQEIVLVGSFIKRKLYGRLNLKVLTLQGDLDGVVRTSRMAESLYHHKNQIAQYPHIILKGLNHASTVVGLLPELLLSKDMKSEVEKSEGIHQIAETIVQFIDSKIFKNAMLGLRQKVARTVTYLDPIIDALTLEANYALKPACYNVKDKSDCWNENPWTKQYGNTIMAGLNNSYTLNLTDILWPSAWVFPHDYLPEVEGKCSSTPCTLKIRSVTENIYHNDTKYDFGDTPIAAFEMRAKIAARQMTWQAAGVPGADNFTYTDGANLCEMINQNAIDWALKNADADALARYNAKGEKMQVGPDEGPYNEGPIWIWINLDYKESDGKMVVRSPTQKSPTDYWIPLAAGFHFCKLLSPAKAMEWIYYDSLKAPQKIQETE